ncbi:CLUMA_CG014264, isoform A [Clunio marinus]|uniref:CLUMA_CG014264, isoform A n=1 Tax=Clunio marinus TaxID=568069 RepID=A0A1J1IN52_9DIPT|nr:CLUMA_CG014264, isoform A [Clunio marinus]
MFFYILILIVLVIVWLIKDDLFNAELLKDYSENSVPLLKSSFGLVNRAREAEIILGSSKHIDKSMIYNFIHPFLRTGLLTSNGEKWHNRRRLLTPAFHFEILKEYFEVFKEESDKLVLTLKEKAGHELNVIPISTQFTLNTICESAMGVKLTNLGNDGAIYRKNIYLTGEKLLFRFLRPWLIPEFIYTISGHRKEIMTILKPVHDFTRSIFMERKMKFVSEKETINLEVEDDSENIYFGSKKRKYAMMDTLLQAQAKGLIDDEGILEETDTFTFEGHDTTSAAMTFTLLLLAHHPEAQERILEEIKDIIAASGHEELSIDDYNRTEYLDRVMKESMRIYPPVPFISRTISEEFTLDGVTHKKGSVCNVHIFDVHRDPEVFPDPEKFDPDRFLPENNAQRSNFAFIAFSAGMRNCIGQRFAMLELKVMLTKIIRNFIISPVTKRDEVVFIADVVLRSKNPVEIKLNVQELFLFARKAARTINASYQHYFFGILSYNVIKAHDAEKLLSSSKHIEKGRIYTFLDSFLKTGLLTSSGEKWHTRRRLLTPAFHFEILKEYFEVFREESEKLIATIKKNVNNEINIVPISTQFTLNTICESAMGVKLSDFGNDGEIYRTQIYEIGKLLMFRIMRPWIHFNFTYWLFGHRKNLDAVLKHAHDFTRSIIHRRKMNFDGEGKQIDDASENVYFRSKKRRFAMMDTLLQAQKSGLIDDEGIMEETDTFPFEGHDPTSAAMTFTLLLLAHHPEAQEKIFQEVQEILEATGRNEPAIDDFNKMEYLDRVVKECLRIYPPVPFISRLFSEDFYYKGVTHPKGTSFHIYIYDIHRDPEVFPDPEKFDPDRFLPENCATRSNYAFIAFSAGMRNCIGQRFALLEIKTMLIKIIRNFKISPITTREEIVFVADMILRPKDSIKMKFFLR